MLRTNICFLVKDDKVLLAMKKRGFGAGKWNGVGGKAADGEAIKEATIRETKEEIGVTPTSLKQVASINFTSIPANNFNSICTVYLCDSWDGGEPAESEEMRPQWFSVAEIPYTEMRECDALWIPKVLAGKLLTVTALYDSDDKLKDYSDKEVKDFATNVHD